MKQMPTGEVYSRKIIATHTYIYNIDDTRTKFIRLYKFVASCRRITSICVTEIIVFEERGMSKPRVRGIFGIMGHGSSHEDSHGLFKARLIDVY